MINNTKTALICGLFLIAGVIGLILCSKIPSPEDIARKQSDIRIAVVESQRNQLSRELLAQTVKIDSAMAELAKKPKEITKIKLKYVESRDSIKSLPRSERTKLFAKRVSKGAHR